jgi:hypothetical protein
LHTPLHEYYRQLKPIRPGRPETRTASPGKVR